MDWAGGVTPRLRWSYGAEALLERLITPWGDVIPDVSGPTRHSLPSPPAAARESAVNLLMPIHTLTTSHVADDALTGYDGHHRVL